MSDQQTQIQKQPPATIDSGEKGLALRSLDEMWRFAQIALKSDMAPKGLDTNEKVFIALQMGAELGITPMQSLQNIAVINGRPMIWGDLPLALCRSSGIFDDSCWAEWLEGNGDDLTAYTSCRRIGSGPPCKRGFSVAMAKRAGLWGKDIWSKYPDRMLQMRARSRALRDEFPDVLKGVPIKEEHESVDVEVTAAHSRPLQRPKAIGEQTSSLPVQPAANPTPAQEPPSADAAPSAPGAAPTPEPAPSKYIGQKQIGLLMQACKDGKVTEDQLKDYLFQRYSITSRKDITIDLYDSIVEWAKHGGVD